MTTTAATAPASPMAQHTSTKGPKPRRQTQIQDDAALAGYLASKMRDEQPFQDSYMMWNYQQNGIYAPADWSLYQHQYAAASGHQYYYIPTYYQYQYGPSVAQQQMLQQGPRAPTPKSMGRESLQIQKSSSTPLPSASNRPRQHHPHPQQQQHQHGLSSTMQSKPSSPTVPSPTRRHHPDEPSRRQRQHPSTARILQQESNPSRPSSSSSSTISSGTNASSEFSTGRRSSVTSVSSSVSIQSEMSMNTKPSLSKKLRKVFSVSGLRSKQNQLGSLTEGNGSNVSLSTVDDASSVMSAATSASNASRTRSIRRRSIASLSSLFQKNSTNVPTVPEEEECDAPEKGPAQHQQRAATPPPELPSPVSKRRSRPVFNKDSPVADLRPPPATPFPLQDSPRLRPATSSSSLATEITSFSKTRSNKIQFCPTIQVHETFSSREYDRRCDPNATCQKLSPLLAMKIKQELNEYKLTDMEIHVESRQYTHFFF